MLKTKLNKFLITLLFCLLGILVYTYKSPPLALSATTHVVVSEIQIAGTSANDEFVELYNPTSDTIDLASWRLTKKTASGIQSNLVASLSGTIQPHGYFLITSPEAAASGSADKLYSTANHLATNNSVTLYSDAGITVVDLVGMGTAIASETAGIANPVSNGSVERKANSNSTDVSMGTGGSDEFAGNGEDTDNNSNDFVQRTVSNPQNSQSSIEPLLASPTPSPSSSPEPTPTPSASPQPSVSPDVSPTPTPLATPSPTPDVSPSPSASPDVSPTPTPSPIPSSTPSPTPSVNPLPSASSSPSPSTTPNPSVTPSPSVSPAPTPTPPGDVIFQGNFFTCRIHYRLVSTRFFSFFIPQIRCSRI